MDNEKSIGHVTIELVNTSKHDKPHKWGQIKSDGRHVLVGMYEDGEVARQLFYMNKANVKQLANVLTMLSETLIDDNSF